jgi:hypothetical protein
MRKILALLFAWVAFCGYEVAHAQVGGGFPPAVPFMKITCTAACAIPPMKVGQFAVIIPSATESRTSTVTPTTSTNLNILSCTGGCGGQTFNFWMSIQWTNAGGVQGIRWNITTASCGTGFNGVGFGLNGSVTPTFTGIITAGNGGATTAASGNDYAWGTWNTGASNTIGLCWAQNVSGATATILNTNSYLLIQRIF